MTEEELRDNIDHVTHFARSKLRGRGGDYDVIEMETRISRIRAAYGLEPVAIHLSAEDSKRVAEALLDPPEPNEALREAFRRHREQVTGEEES